MEDLIKLYREAVELNCRIFDEFGDDIKGLIEDYETVVADCKRRRDDILNSTEIRLNKIGKYEFKDGLLSVLDWDCLGYCFSEMVNVAIFFKDYLGPSIQNKLHPFAGDLFLNPDIKKVKETVAEMSLTAPMLTNEECFNVLKFLEDSAQRKVITFGGKNGSHLYQCLKSRNQKEFIALLDDVETADSNTLRVYLATRVFTLPSMHEYIGKYISEGLEKGDDNVRCYTYSMAPDLSCLVDSANTFINSPSKELFYEMLLSFQKSLRDMHGQILSQFNDDSIHPLRLKEAKAIYERAKFIFGTDEPTQFDFKPFDIQIGTIVMSEAGIYALHRYLEDNPDDSTGEHTIEGAINTNTPSLTDKTDYSRYFAPVAPPVNYSQMRKIAMLLAGKEIVGKSIIESQTRYIHPKDVTRFCYFFLHKCESPDDLRKVDFTNPIQWLDDWESLKYLISRLYRDTKTLPSNLAKEVTEAFRFKLKRQRDKSIPGKISKATFNNSKDINEITPNEDRLRINEILKDVGIRQCVDLEKVQR